MNEGCACFTHFHIINALHADGQLTDGAFLEMLHVHSNVLNQPGFDTGGPAVINPYALGFAIFTDIKRMSLEPTQEDRDWFPHIAGRGDWLSVIKDIIVNYRDESFILQFLSPHIMRQFRMFSILDDEHASYYRVSNIHNDDGYRNIRHALSRNHDISVNEPDVQIVDVDLLGDRKLVLEATSGNGARLAEEDAKLVVSHVQHLWGYEVRLTGKGAPSGGED